MQVEPPVVEATSQTWRPQENQMVTQGLQMGRQKRRARRKRLKTQSKAMTCGDTREKENNEDDQCVFGLTNNFNTLERE